MRDIQQYKKQILGIFDYYSSIGLLQEDVYAEILNNLQPCSTIEEMTQVIDMDTYIQYFTYVSNRILPRVDTLRQQGINYDLFGETQITPFIAPNIEDMDMTQDMELQDEFEEEESISTPSDEDTTTYIDLGDTYTYIDDTPTTNSKINDSANDITDPIPMSSPSNNTFFDEYEEYDEDDADEVISFPIEDTFNMPEDDTEDDMDQKLEKDGDYTFEDSLNEEENEYYDDEEDDEGYAEDEDEDEYATTVEPNTPINTTMQTQASSSEHTPQKAVAIPQVYEDAATQKLLEQVTKLTNMSQLSNYFKNKRK